MRKLISTLIIASLLMTGIVSCKKIISAVFGGTDIQVPAIEFTLPVILAVSADEVNLGTVSQHINLDSIIKANTAGVFGVNAVSSIKVKQVNINLPDADPLNNLANFKNARVTLQSDVNGNTADIFLANFPDTYSAVYSYTPVNGPDLLPYLKGNTLTYNVYGTARRTTSKPLNMQVSVTLRAN